MSRHVALVSTRVSARKSLPLNFGKRCVKAAVPDGCLRSSTCYRFI